jgi:diguanylate cyclase (GGDEF)-like protein
MVVSVGDRSGGAGTPGSGAEIVGGEEPAVASKLAPSDAVDEVLEAVVEATRGLLWIDTEADVARLASDLVTSLGGTLVLTSELSVGVLPLDVSFGLGPPMLPSGAGSTVSMMLLERHMPLFVRDAHRALELAAQASRLADDASVDALTGLANKRSLGRALGRLRNDDTVIMIDLDRFKDINDTLGHVEGDRVLRAFGRIMATSARDVDRCGRYGGEEFVVILRSGDPDAFLRRFQGAWEESRPQPVTFSAGVASVGPHSKSALQAADRAMYRAKQSGRDQWKWAGAKDYE